jgi:hypothetical protein
MTGTLSLMSSYRRTLTLTLALTLSLTLAARPERWASARLLLRTHPWWVMVGDLALANKPSTHA